jgi:nuclear pore complex protein Nup133
MLPVLVVEAISNEDVPVQSLSIKITDMGWACLVSGTSLFVWKFNSGPSRTCPCYELELPPSDLTFKADLVTLITAGTTGDSDAVSVLAVSPEGIVRFWSNILHETCFTEAVVQELQGQECSNVCPIGSNACLLATTTNSLLLISIIQNEPAFRTLKAPVGVLSGLGKKFTSFIFGGMPVPQANETKSFIRIFKESDEPGRDFAIVYTMAGSTVQQWQILSHESEVLRAEKDLDHILKDRFLGSIAVTCDPRQANVMILDAGLGQEKQLLLLVASLVPGDRIRFAIATFITVHDSFALTDFHLIADPSAFLSVHNEETLLNLKLLLCPDRSTIYVYDDARIFFIRGNAVVDMINFEVNDDGILGAGCCDKIPLLFTCRDGLVTISSSIIDFPDQSILSESVHGEAGQPQSAQTDKFRRAFYLFSRDEKEQAVSIISDAFDVSKKPEELAHVILSYVEEISDANFTPDEVWEDKVKRHKVPQSFSSQDIFVTRQLENKIATVNLIIELIDSFPAVGDQVVREIPLLLSLNDILEKQMVALSSKANWMEFLFLTEPVLLSLADQWNSTNKNFVHDEFFRHSSRVHEMIPALIKFAESKLDPSLMSGEETLQLLMSTAELVINIMSDVFSRRDRLPSCLTKFCNKLENFSAWDSVTDGTRCHLIRLFSLLENPGCRLAATSDENNQNRDCVFDRMAHLADVLLSSFSYQINFMRPSSSARHSEEKIFQELRSNILRPLIAGNQYEKAIFLAEKYQDFDALIEISELTNKPDLLNKYACMFSSHDFTGHLFKWYMERGRQEMVLQSPHMFSQMLEGHSDLHWLQQIEDNDFGGAAKTLKSLAVRETENMAKKRTILSLCKLSQLIAPDAHPDPDVDNLLAEISYQDFSETIQ